MTRVVTIAGTRPELIRLSRIVSRLADTVDHTLVHTGQNWHPGLRDAILADLDMPAPDRHLDVDTSSLGAFLGGVLVATEELLTELRPDAVVILGDTNSAIAAVMARRMQVPVYHLEAGNRCFDNNVPEEVNRRLVDHVSDFNLVYTEHARRNLLAEGLHPRRIALIGSPMREVLNHHAAAVDRSPILAQLGLTPRGYLLASMHRAENVDPPARLAQVVDCLDAASTAFRLPVLVSTHPRTRKRLDQAGVGRVRNVSFQEPFGFVDWLRLQRDAWCVLSDSGTVAEEASFLGFPAVTLRDSTERPEAVEAGTLIVTGLDPAAVVEAVRTVVAQAAKGPVPCPPDYLITDTSRRVVDYLLSTNITRRGQSATDGL